MLVDKCDNSHVGLFLKSEADVVMILSEIVDSVPLDVMKGFLTLRPEVSIGIQTRWHLLLPALMHPLRTLYHLLRSHLDLILSLGPVSHLHQPQPQVCAGTDLKSVRHFIIPLLPAGNACLLAFGAQVSGFFPQLRGVGFVYIGA
jgi:hypothetical protein